MLAVHQDFRSNGFGSKLVMLAVDTMKKKGCTEVVLETEIGNSGALMLYEGLGFVRDKRLDKVCRGEDVHPNNNLTRVSFNVSSRLWG